jgi:hypothetical protein
MMIKGSESTGKLEKNGFLPCWKKNFEIDDPASSGSQLKYMLASNGIR